MKPPSSPSVSPALPARQPRTGLGRRAFSRRALVFALALLPLGGVGLWTLRDRPVPIQRGRAVAVYPHDPRAYSQGLVWKDGWLYESTGRNGASSVRQVELKTGVVKQRKNLRSELFGEGLALHDGKLIQVTWKSRVALVWDLASLELIEERRFSGQGWGLASNGKDLALSDGTEFVRFLDPETLAERRRIRVHTKDGSVASINELEFVRGELWANVWKKDYLVRIDPEDGNVLGWIDLSGLADFPPVNDPDAVLNGIAWDAEGERLFVTGKLWPRLYEIEVLDAEPARGEAD